MKETHKHALTVLSVLVLLYLFLVSVGLMGSGFQLLGKGFAEALVAACENPLAGLFIGILATSLIQSSSTTTSLVVGFVAGGVIPFSAAVPILMGANIGTTVTNIIVSLTFVSRKEEFRRAFAGATVHDFFNVYSVLLLFPLELAFGIIEKSSLWLTGVFEGVGGVRFTSPVQAAVRPAIRGIQALLVEVFALPGMVAGAVMLGLAVVTLVLSLVYLVRTLRGVVLSHAEGLVDKYLFRNDLVAFGLGVLLTALVQSSSITTSVAVPLVAAGLLTLRRCYPFTLGANIGTTCTALLASLATVQVVDGKAATIGVSVAFAHLIFNLLGIAVFYPLKRIPIATSVWLADLAVESKRWAIIFLVGSFIVVPTILFLLTR